MKNTTLLQNYIATYDNIFGWFYAPDIQLFIALSEIQAVANFNGPVCEIGVCHGKSLALLTILRGNYESIGIDIFTDDLLPNTNKTLQKFCGSSDSATLIKGNTQFMSIEEVNKVTSTKLRMLHIDGGHEHDEVLNDLTKFSTLVDKTGIIILDDINDPVYPGVSSAMAEFLQCGNNTDWTTCVIGHNKIYLCNPALRKYYQSRLLSMSLYQSRLRLTKMWNSPTLMINVDRSNHTLAECMAGI